MDLIGILSPVIYPGLVPAFAMYPVVRPSVAMCVENGGQIEAFCPTGIQGLSIIGSK